jgi:hypothetical protein
MSNEAVNQKIDNVMTKEREKNNNDLQNTTRNTKFWATRTPVSPVYYPNCFEGIIACKNNNVA